MVGFELKIWGVRPPLARDKLHEAQYFLDRLRSVGDDQPAFRYLFAATVCAARSVTLILQSDLRSRAGAAFDAWWTDRCNRLSVGSWTFKALAETRNLSQKEGNIYPAPVYVLDYNEGPVEHVEYVWVGPGADYATTPAAVAPSTTKCCGAG